MPELEGFSAKEVIKILQSGSKVCVVPLHKELLVGTLKGILRQAGISIQRIF